MPGPSSKTMVRCGEAAIATSMSDGGVSHSGRRVASDAVSMGAHETRASRKLVLIFQNPAAR